jgi:hypothetical protein
MCTAVVGGFTHLAATSNNAASSQQLPTLIAIHSTTDRRETFRRAVLSCGFAFGVTSQNNGRAPGLADELSFLARAATGSRFAYAALCEN